MSDFQALALFSKIAYLSIAFQDIITFKRVKVTEEEEEMKDIAPVAELKEEVKENEVDEKSEVSFFDYAIYPVLIFNIYRMVFRFL